MCTCCQEYDEGCQMSRIYVPARLWDVREYSPDARIHFNLSRFCSQEKFIFIVWPQGLTDALDLTLVLSCWKRAHISLKSKETVWNMWNIGFKCNMVLHYIARSRWEGNWVRVRTKDSFAGVTCFPESRGELKAKAESYVRHSSSLSLSLPSQYRSSSPLRASDVTSAHVYAFLPPSKRHRLANKYTHFQERGGEGKRCLQAFNVRPIQDTNIILILQPIQRSAKKYANLAKHGPGQGQPEQVSKSSNKLLATTYQLFSRSLHMYGFKINIHG